MIRLAFIYILWGFVSAASAQDSPVLMRIDGKKISRTEFKYYYHKNNAHASAKRKSMNEYVDSFIDFKLRVAAAEAAGLDTTRHFQAEWRDFYHQSLRSCLTEVKTTEQDAHRLHDKQTPEQRTEQVLVKHIFKYLPQNITGYTLREMEAKMDSIYQQLKEEPASATFDTYVNSFSDDKKTFLVKRTHMPVEFEDIVFNLQAEEISSPFFTPQGIHIVKVLERKKVPALESTKHKSPLRQPHRHDTDKEVASTVEKLKKEYSYTPDKAGMSELLLKGTTHRTLFTLANKQYTGKDFARFATAHPAGVSKQLDNFIAKSVLDYENSRLEQKHPEFPILMQAYRDSLLVAAITHREIEEKSLKDEYGLKAYFEAHRSEFHWEEPRYRGIVLHCTTKRIAKQARKFLKKLPQTEWKDAIRLTFNAGGKQQIQTEQGLFAPGDNVHVDEWVFKRRKATPLLSSPFTIVLGEKQKDPDSWQEVREALAAAYRKHLAAEWTAKLRATAEVDLDEEVLKTVNNH